MASSSRASKAQKTAASSSRAEDEPALDPQRFVNRAAEIIYQDFTVKRSVVPEKPMFFTQEEDAYVYNEIQSRKWQVLTTYPVTACKQLVWEFLANGQALQAHEDTRKVVMVRGQRVSFTRKRIASILQLPEVKDCAFKELMRTGEWDPEEVKETLCFGGEWIYARNGKPSKIEKKYFKPYPKMWSTYVQDSIMPTGNTSEMFTKRILLVYAIHKGLPVDIASIIHDELCQMIKSNFSSFGFSSLICLLCRKNGVQDRIEIPLEPKLGLTFMDINPSNQSTAAPRRPNQPRPQPRKLTQAERLDLIEQKVEGGNKVLRQIHKMMAGQYLHSGLTEEDLGEPIMTDAEVRRTLLIASSSNDEEENDEEMEEADN